MERGNSGNPGNTLEKSTSTISNPQYHVKETRRNTVMLISDEIKDRGIFPSPSFYDVFRKINALRTYFGAEKK